MLLRKIIPSDLLVFLTFILCQLLLQTYFELKNICPYWRILCAYFSVIIMKIYLTFKLKWLMSWQGRAGKTRPRTGQDAGLFDMTLTGHGSGLWGP